jgi:Thioredoxin domain
VSLADRMAIASPRVSALTVEATEFPELAREFYVQGVPRTVVNRGGAFVGALPEEQFVAAVLDLAGMSGVLDAEAVVEPDATEGDEAAEQPGEEDAGDVKMEGHSKPGSEPDPGAPTDREHGRG